MLTNTIKTPPFKLNPGVKGQEKIVDLISNKANNAKVDIIYCGPWDSSFILSAALHDEGRKMHICRVDSTVKNEKELLEYLNQLDTSFIVYETGNFLEHQLVRKQLRESIKNYINRNRAAIIYDATHPIQYRAKGVRTEYVRVVQIKKNNVSALGESVQRNADTP